MNPVCVSVERGARRMYFLQALVRSIQSEVVATVVGWGLRGPVCIYNI